VTECGPIRQVLLDEMISRFAKIDATSVKSMSDIELRAYSGVTDYYWDLAMKALWAAVRKWHGPRN